MEANESMKRKNPWPVVSVALALILNFGHSIWWASATNAKLDSALEVLKAMYPRQEAEVRFQAVSQRVDSIERRVESRGRRDTP